MRGGGCAAPSCTTCTPTLVDKLAEDGSALSLGGEKRVISVMFADLTGFTVASTEMTAEALTSKVNQILHYIVAPIDQTGGYVERFLGPSALAMVAVLLSDAKHAVNAVRAAMAIIENGKRAFEEDAARGVHGFTIKVGINSGRAVVGNIGSENRYSYTAMGEDINLAARLESRPPGIWMLDCRRRAYRADGKRGLPDARAGPRAAKGRGADDGDYLTGRGTPSNYGGAAGSRRALCGCAETLSGAAL